MATVVDIYNWALAAVGTRARIQSPTESSPEAEQCSLWYASVRDQILRSAPWDSASAWRRLGLNAERAEGEAWTNTDPAPGWHFSYASPSDLLWPRYLSTYAKFELGVDAEDHRVINTNQEQAILRYTKRQTKVELWEPDLQAAIAFGLGAHIAMKLTGSENRVQLLTAQAIDKIMAARAAGMNTAQAELESVPDWIVARGYVGSSPTSLFLYPNAEFSVQGFTGGSLT